MPSPGKVGTSPPRVFAIDVESQTRPSGSPIRSHHHHRDTYDGDLVPRPCGEFPETSTVGGNMKVTFKVLASDGPWSAEHHSRQGPQPFCMDPMRRHVLLPNACSLFLPVGSIGCYGLCSCTAKHLAVNFGQLALVALQSFLLGCPHKVFQRNFRTCVQDLNYRVRNNAKSSERITLLYKVSGYLLPGHLSVLVSRQPNWPSI